ncbi:MAG: hypothetical protein NWE89_12280 [Candidatus Bathyarchaeota archaeon]|nr:hypothetical protein [Candidatus Bathyarchaeota archaeon]
MQETVYENGRRVVRLGPLEEVAQAAMRDLHKENVRTVKVTKVADSIVEEAVEKVMRMKDNANSDKN